jgi:bifunctional enzyme CysN/CysC
MELAFCHEVGPALDGDLLRFLTCGSVDDGKSTLIGRLLHDTKLDSEDQFSGLVSESERRGTAEGGIDFALLLDGLEAEREQGITIDVAYRFFGTARRSFIVADTPGHEHFTRNMATAASNAELAVILIDARKGVLVQTRRHSFICSLLGIRHIVVAINKIDLVDYDRNVYERIVDDYASFATALGFSSIVSIPLSARYGDNVTRLSARTPWYRGPSLFEYLETVDVQGDAPEASFRFPVQLVIRPNQDFRGYAGTVASGKIRKGDPVVVANSGLAARVKDIVTYDGSVEKAERGDAVTLVLSDELDVGRGAMLASPTARPEVSAQFAAHIIWMDQRPLLPGRSYLMRIGTKTVPASITAIKYKIDVTTRDHLAAPNLGLNDIGFCNVSCTMPVAFDPYGENHKTGSFILVDRFTNRTAGAGMIAFGLRRGTNIHHQPLLVNKAARAALKGQKPAIVWFTGLSGAGKSTIANMVEQRLNLDGHHTMMLDGDNVRHGLNRDLGFTEADRVENIRRIGEVAKLMVEGGLIVLCSFISPYQADREMVRGLFDDGEFIEVFVDTLIEDCMRRDPKGLYAKAKAGKLKNFTGVDAPYEAPERPEIHLQTRFRSPEELAAIVLGVLGDRGIVEPRYSSRSRHD